MILPAQHIRRLALEFDMITPFNERGDYQGMTFGLGPSTYDIRIRQSANLYPGECLLASSIERLKLPNDVRAILLDKSSWARRFVTVQNTKFDPGFEGYCTLELINHGKQFIELQEGMPIGQLEFAQLLEPTELPYQGRYQYQPDEPVPYRPAKGVWE